MLKGLIGLLIDPGGSEREASYTTHRTRTPPWIRPLNTLKELKERARHTHCRTSWKSSPQEAGEPFARKPTALAFGCLDDDLNGFDAFRFSFFYRHT